MPVCAVNTTLPKAVVMTPVKIPKITSPVRIHTTLNILADNDTANLSPYLGRKNRNTLEQTKMFF